MVDAIIESASVRNVKSARATVTLSFPLSGHSSLFMELAESVGGPMRVAFEKIAQQLEFGDDPNEGLAAAPRHWQTEAGDVVMAHLFMAGDADGTCGLCAFDAAHECHQAAFVVDPQTETLADKLLASIDDGPDAPTEEQAEVREALASRSRINGPRASK